MIGLLTGPVGKVLGLFTIGLVLFGFGYWRGRIDMKTEQLKDTIAAIEKRERIDDRVQGLDGIALCNELLGGGMHAECSQLRGVEEDSRRSRRSRQVGK